MSANFNDISNNNEFDLDDLELENSDNEHENNMIGSHLNLNTQVSHICCH